MTPEEFVKVFSKTCESEGVLFVPDPVRDKAVARSLIKHHTKYFNPQILNKSAVMYIRGRVESASVADFAMNVKEYRDRATREIESVDNFRETMRKTKERHESLKESN